MRGRETSKENRRNICNESHTRARLRIRRFQTVATRPIKYKYLDTSQEQRANKRLPCAVAEPAFFWGARTAGTSETSEPVSDLESAFGAIYPGAPTRRRTDGSLRTRLPSRFHASSIAHPRAIALRVLARIGKVLRIPPKVQLSETSWEINRETSNAGPRSDRARRAHRSEPSARRTGVFASRGTSH